MFSGRFFFSKRSLFIGTTAVGIVGTVGYFSFRNQNMRRQLYQDKTRTLNMVKVASNIESHSKIYGQTIIATLPNEMLNIVSHTSQELLNIVGKEAYYEKDNPHATLIATIYREKNHEDFNRKFAQGKKGIATRADIRWQEAWEDLKDKVASPDHLPILIQFNFAIIRKSGNILLEFTSIQESPQSKRRLQADKIRTDMYTTYNLEIDDRMKQPERLSKFCVTIGHFTDDKWLQNKEEYTRVEDVLLAANKQLRQCEFELQEYQLVNFTERSLNSDSITVIETATSSPKLLAGPNNTNIKQTP